MGLVKSKSSRHIDEPPKYEETKTITNYNPYNIEKTITAEEVRENTIKMYEEKYNKVIKKLLEFIFSRINQG